MRVLLRRRPQTDGAQLAIGRPRRPKLPSHEHDAGHPERAEALGRRPGDGFPQRRARVPLPPSWIENTADGEMRMPGTVLGRELATLERRLDMGLKIADRERALGHTNPQDARTL